MEFGRVAREQLGAIDFTLPVGNSDVLDNSDGPGRLYIGLPRWGVKEFVGTIYPAGTKDREFLDRYVQLFDTIELNATHYNIYPPQKIQEWAATVAELKFRFCPKMFNGITHSGSLLDKENELQAFLGSVRHFGGALGPIFIQLSDSFSLRRARELGQFLESLPGDFTFFVEIRGEDWYRNNNWYRWLQDMGIGAVITDTAGRRDVVHMNLTIPKAMVRFVATNHESDYPRLDSWIQRIRLWQSQGIEEIYFFMHSKNEIESVGLVDYLKGKLAASSIIS